MRKLLLSFLAFALPALAAAQTMQPVRPYAPWPVVTTASLSQNSLTIDLAGERVACVFRAQRSGTIDKFEFDIVTLTTAEALRVSLQDVSLTNGDPDGTQDQFRDIATGSVVAGWNVPGLITSDGTDTGVKRTVTTGDLLALVVEFVTTGGNLTIATTNQSFGLGNDTYLDHFTASWAKNTSSSCGFALKYDDGTYVATSPYATPMDSATSTVFSETSTPDERALIFTAAWKIEIGGAWAAIDADAAVEVRLYDTNGTTVLATATLDPDVRATTSVSISYVYWAPITLTAGGTYRLSVRPTTASNVSLRELTFASNAILGGTDGGINLSLSTQSNTSGTWSPTTTIRPLIGLLISGLSDNACSGSGGVKCVVR